ncbi:SDR family NAD(P)-dependent oxidoreductase [Xanthomonas campestris pv. trichodesmae]|uniref:Polyketide synthase n=1 Tax=Xanthomonas citri pv. vignicola TaxID=473426 RepID=A0AB33CMY0_XANCI|nr:SDR family NAD(P)-dependent oxidoreductase [Xanthomonas citri]ASK92171.1 hypothetical protein XcvCFBP7111P_12200 [Xanthomonas citri pv. vignicola]MBV6782912.1 SDR family NAD(P)-dependent oxidoreductase [Xanthomonas campestris pv. trichodesmae]
MSHTLACGRHHFEHRCAVVVDDREHALDRLDRLAGGERLADVFRGEAPREFVGQPAQQRHAQALFERLETALPAADEREILHALADLHCQGYTLPWARLFGTPPPRHIPLPGYPFERERHWVDGHAAVGTAPSAPSMLHPLLHRNTSTLAAQRFTSTFDGREFYLRDHVVNGRPTLPAACHIEMACRAATLSIEETGTNHGIGLRDIAWIRPLAVSSATDVHTRLTTSPGGDVAFDIHTRDAATRDEAVLAQGSIVVLDASARRPDRLDLDGLRANAVPAWDGKAHAAGQGDGTLRYGDAFRSIVALHTGDDLDGRYVLAHLRLPSCVADTHDRYIVHPSMLDGALQTVLGVASGTRHDGDGGAPTPGTVPFAADAVDVWGVMPAEAWAHLRMRCAEQVDGNLAARTATIDVNVCDAEGQVVVAIRGLSLMSPGSGGTAADEPIATVLRGDEFFLADHRHIVPGVVFLEAARAAAERREGHAVVGMTHIVWRSPMAAPPGETTLYTHLARRAAGVDFTMSATATPLPGSTCAQGVLLTNADDAPSRPPRADLDGVVRRCPTRIEGSACHALLGVMHGPRMFPIRSIRHAEYEAIAHLELPASGLPVHAGVLHPTLMHGAVLAAVCFSLIQDGERQLRLPFTLQTLWIHASTLPSVCHAHVRQVSAADGAIRRYDIDVLDTDGECLVRLEGFTTRSPAAVRRPDVIHAVPAWRDAPPAAGMRSDATHDPVFLVPHGQACLHRCILEVFPAARVVWLDPPTSAESIANNVLRAMALVQELIGAGRDAHVLLPLPDDEAWHAHAAIEGLLKTARNEHPRVRGRLLHYPASSHADPERLRRWLVAEADATDETSAVRYHEGTRQVLRWEEAPVQSTSHTGPFTMLQPGDVVWITGGAGGIGRLLARHVGRETGVRVVLSGRTPPTDDAWLSTLRADGIDACYVRCDVTRADEVEAALASEPFRDRRLRGVLHAAGVVRDAWLARKTATEAAEVLAPKIAGTLVLDEATRDAPLAFFAVFSSLAAVMGNPGQADYAAANAFLDAFALHRDAQVEAGVRQGHTCSINWPLWREGGMRVDAQTEEQARHMIGLEPLDTAEALASLAWATATGAQRLLVAQGRSDMLRAVLFADAPPATPTDPESAVLPVSSTDDARLASLTRELAEVAATVLKMDADAIDGSTGLSHYGFDSIYLTEYANHLNRRYGLKLMPTVFFECSSLAALAQHLLSRHAAAFAGTAAADARSASSPTLARPSRRAGTAQASTSGSSMSAPSTSVPAPVEDTSTSVAIVGMSGRFPGSADVGEFWTRLADNADLISDMPLERVALTGGLVADRSALPAAVRLAGYIDGIDCFDPMFFGITPIEAGAMDPQQRLFIEHAWACVEDAGYRATSLAGSRTGVFVGVSTSDYKDLCQLAGMSSPFGGDAAFHFMIANRLSYLLDLRGPSEPVDTACSSSLVALHRAVRAIQSGECEAALVGGVNVIVNPVNGMRAHQAGMLSDDGRCKTFDASADGYGRGEGVAVLMLKPLAAARADRDHVYGVIVGSAENHGGRASSPTAPNPLAQRQLLVDAYRGGGIDPATVGYIEAHGTGTALGDPVEVNALKAAFDELHRERRPGKTVPRHCALGSVKTNIGHLEAAAGVAGVIKVLLMFAHRCIPGNGQLKSPNPYLELDDGPFYLARESVTWAAPVDAAGRELPRRAGVSGFGIGGSNAHVVLESFEATEPSHAPVRLPALVVLSAKTATALREQAQRLHAAVSGPAAPDLHDLAFTLQVGREAMDHRLGFVVESMEQLAGELAGFVSDRAHQGTVGVVTHRPGDSTRGDNDDTLDAGLQKGQYSRMLERWTRGLAIDWHRLYAGSAANARLSPRRVSLPTYPFARESYWVNLHDNRHSNGADAAVAHETARAGDGPIEALIDGLLGHSLTLDDALRTLERMDAGLD